MGYRFLDDYDPRKEQKKKQQQKGTQKAPPSGNPLNPAAQNNKNNKTNTPAATQPRTSKGTALGGSSVTPVQLPVQQITVPKLTKAATPMQTQTPQALTLKLPNIQAFGAGDYSKAGKAMDRIAKTVQAGAAQTASGFAEIAGQFRPTTGQQSMGQFSGFGDLGRAVRENREKGTDINTSILLQERQRRVQQKQSQQKIFDAATRLTERGQQYTQEAKQGLGTVGQFLVDMGVTGTQMAGDALANLILPGSGLVMMGMRSYGQAAGEARREGKGEGQQFLAGLKSAGIEVFTEKMFGAFSKIYGGAAADELVQKLVGKLTENATGQALLTWIVNAVGEGVEEVTSDLLNPLADRLLRLDDGKGPVWSTDDLAQWGYDFLLGTAMGMFGGGQQLVRGVQQGQAQTAENNYYADLRRNGLGSANRAANAQRASDAMGRIMPTRDGLRMPRLVDEQGRTYEERTTWQQIPESRRAEFDEAQRIAQRFGARVVVSQQEGVNGSYRDGVISLNPNAANPVRQTLIHELTHHMESSGRYSEFRETALQYVAENMGADVDSVRQALMADYAQNGVTLDEDGATREIVAKFAEEKLFTDEATVRRLLAEDRNLFQRIYDWIRDMAGRLTGTSEENFLRDAEKLYAKALQETTAETGRVTQMLFAGENARTANMQTLNRAQALEAGGAAAEDIRRETGWFRGMDGKWRFEIDDSSMEYRAGGDARLLEESGYRRLDELTEKWVRNAEGRGEPLTAEELAESERLESEYFDRVWTDEKYELADFLRHSSLFEAYPQLRHASLVFEKTEPGVNGYYNARTDTIVLSDKLRGAPESTLVHEIQHLIQRTEGFARGSTPEYWAARDYETGEITQALEQEYNQVLHGLDSKTLNKYLRYQEVNRAMENLESAEEGTPAAEKYVQLDRISDQLYMELWDIPEFKRLLDLKRQIDTPREVYDRFYRSTAGEIEARDAANRRSYNAEQRRLHMPDLGNANTVFADDGVGYFAMSAEEQAGIREQLRRNSDRLNAMDVVGRVNTRAYAGLDTGKARTKLVEELGRRGYTVNRPGLGEVQFSEKEINNSLNYKEKNPAAEDARRTGFLVLRDVLKRGIEIDGHDGHKGRNYDTVTIAAPVEINGKRGNMAVVVKKTKGNRYKVHRILTPVGETFILPEMANAEVNTVGAVTNNSQLLRGSAPAINSASEFSIPNNGGNVNTEQYSTGRGLDDITADEDTGRGLRMPQLTDAQGRTYEERTRAKAEAGTSVVRDRVRQMDAMTDAAAERAMEQRTQQEQQGKEMPEALKKLGVAPFGSEADYAGIDNLAQEMQWNGSARKQTQRQMNKIPATEKERSFARKLADGTLDAADIPNTVNRETVETLADFYRTLDSAPETMLLRQRRAIILEREEAKMEPLLGMDVAYDEGGLRTDIAGLRKPSGKIAKTTSTLRRNLQTPARICATEWGTEHGRKVYETLFYPVTENNGRQIDWVNSMLDRVRTFKDSKGEERPLNRKERELVQKLVEYRASEKRVAAFDEQYKDAVENVRNGASATDAAKMFGIDSSYQEYQDLQNYETYLKALEDLHDSKSADDMAVGKAVEAYSGLYRELYDGINSFLAAHGYQPIGFIEGYAPHMQPEAEKTAFSKAMKLLGLDDTAMSLPTSISGKTADLKPYKQYNPFFQERHGVNTEYDIAKGFEEYIYYLSNIFYHTDDIMRIRTAEKYIRKTYSSEEASELINQAESARDFSNDQIADFLRVSGVVQKGTKLAPGDARVFLEDYIGRLYDQIGNVTRYSEMAKYLNNYANRLAGKQNMADRGAEAATGRGSLNWINTLTGKYGGAKLAFNFSSALNQTSQIPMVAAENGERATACAIGDFFKSKKGRADFVQESNFLKGKKGIDWLLGAETPWEKVKEFSFSPIEAVDSFTSYVAVRSKYLKEIRAGKSHEDAMKLADEYGRNVMGSRARGEKPMLFDTKNPFWQIVTRFQLEALNTWEHISRDLPNEVRQLAREKGKAYAAGTMGVRVAKYLIYGFLLNLGVGALSGGSPVPYDVVGSVMEALGKSMGVSKLAMVGKLVDNVLEAIFDKRLFGTDGDDDEDDAEKDWWAFLGSLWGDIANDVPIVGQLAALTGVGDETLPVADLSKVGDFVESVKKKGVFNGDTLDKGLTAASEFVYGGNQLRKTIQGGKAVVQGGVYSNGKLRYQVDQTPMNYFKGFLFGRSALGESQAYYAERTSDFSENQTEAFQQMQDAGVSAKASYDLIQELREIEKTEESTKAELQRDALRQSSVSGAGKWVAYYQTMASETEWKAMDAVEYHSEADYGTVTNLLMDMKDLETDAEKMHLIDSSDLTEQQKASLYKNLVAGKEDLKKIYALLDADISDYQYFQYKLTTSGLTKKEAKLNAINTLDLTNDQKDALYYLNSYASSTHGEAPWVQGMTAAESSVRLAEILAEEEEDEDNTPQWQQSLNAYWGKGTTNSEVSQMLANVRQLNSGTAGGYSSGGGLTVSEMLANVRRLNGGTVGGYSSGSSLTVSEMLANVRQLNR